MDYTKLGSTPIDEQNPAGEDVKYDEEFEKIESEISKLTSPSASNEIDWVLVVKLCENILDKKSKNLLVNVYLCYALFKVRGVDGLGDGIGVLADLLEDYWEVLYPPLRRIKGRVNAIEWLLDRVTKELENSENLEIESVKKGEFLTNLKRIDNFLNEHLEDAPLFYNLIKLSDMKLLSPTAETELKSEEKEEIKEDIKSVEGFHMSSGDVEKDFKMAVNSLNLLVGKMIEAKDYRAELFMINRSFVWLDIENLPFADKNKTMLPPPDKQEIEILEKLYKEKDYESLLWAAESRITTYLFWLDLHFYVAEALKNLKKEMAAQSVLEQTQYFIAKLPTLQNLTFSDSTPFASKMTKKWLDSKNKEQSTVKVEQVEKKREKIECTPEGMDKLCKLAKSAVSVEDEVFYNIEICRCLAKNNSATLILAYTKQLLDKIEEYKTDRWKPEMAVDAYLVCIECLSNLSDVDELIEQLQSKLALIKPSLIDS